VTLIMQFKLLEYSSVAQIHHIMNYTFLII